MAENVFDQACRYLAKLDPAGLLRWLLGASLRFRAWLDTRQLPWPGQPDRTCDTVAHLEEDNGRPWAVPIEFQIKPDPQMFGRLLGYLGSLWVERRPDPERGSHFHVAGIVINLTGQGDTSRDMRLPVRGGNRLPLNKLPRTCLFVGECDLERQDAGRILRAIARGTAARCLLPFIPLMQGGGDSAIIRRWLSLALAEPDGRRRADYASLALVFAEAGGRRAVWQQALQRWNVIESQQVREWQVAASLNTRREDLQFLLEDRFGPLPDEVRQRIQATTDLQRLQTALRKVPRMQSLEDLQL